jgi:hypothetical protein
MLVKILISFTGLSMLAQFPHGIKEDNGERGKSEEIQMREKILEV